MDDRQNKTYTVCTSQSIFFVTNFFKRQTPTDTTLSGENSIKCYCFNNFLIFNIIF